MIDWFVFFTAYQCFVSYLKPKHSLDCKNNCFFVSKYSINKFLRITTIFTDKNLSHSWGERKWIYNFRYLRVSKCNQPIWYSNLALRVFIPSHYSLHLHIIFLIEVIWIKLKQREEYLSLLKKVEKTFGVWRAWQENCRIWRR